MRLKRVIYAISFTVLIFLYFNEVFLFDNIFSERDLSVFFYRYIQHWVETLRSGELPLWNPYVMCGEPLLANIQPNILYPLSIIYFVLPVDFAFNMMIVLHFFLSGLFTFLLMKELKASDEAAAISAVSFVFGGYLLSVHNVLSTLLSVAWFPAVIALYLRSLRHCSWKLAVLCGFSLYCMFSGGGLETIIMTAGIISLLTLFPCLYEKNEINISLPFRLMFCSIAFACFVLIGAVQILPFLELIQHSIRSEGISYSEAILWSLEPKNLIYLFAPDIFRQGIENYWNEQSWLKTIYTGVLPFLLAAFFCMEKGKRKFLVFIILATSVFLSLGDYNPLYRFLFACFPVLQKVRYPVKFFFIVIFFICLSAGWGWDYMRKHIRDKAVQQLLFFLFAVFGFFSSIVLIILESHQETIWEIFQLDTVFSLSMFKSSTIFHNINRVILFSIIGSLLLFISGQKPRWHGFAFYGFILLLLLDLFWGNYGHYETVNRAAVHDITENQKVLVRDKGLYRVFVQKKIADKMSIPFRSKEERIMIYRNIFTPNTLLGIGKFDTWGFSVLALKNYFKLITHAQSTALPDSTNLLNLMNARYVLWSEELQCPGYELIQKENFFLYKNTSSLQRAFLVKDYKVLKSEEEFRKTLQGREFDPRETVLLDREPEKLSVAINSEKLLKNWVNVSEYRNNMISMEVESSCSQFLVLSETYYPGWKAYIDSTEAPLYKANFAFRAIAVPAGRHRVVLKYEPLSVRIGACISIAAVLVFIFLLIFLPPPAPPSKGGELASPPCYGKFKK